MAEYMLDNAWEQARRRLALLEAELDPGTIRHLQALGVGEGWHCLEVGGGGGSIADLLCQRVGPSGRVLATDIDTRFLETLNRPNLDVRRHDITAEELPAGAFDLVHTRTVLNHLRARAAALRRMAAAVRPGGWLLVEEGDWLSWMPDPAADAAACVLFRKHWQAHDRFARARGADHYYGRRLYGDLRALWMDEVGAEGRVAVVQGGSPYAQMWRMSFMQVREPTIAAGLLTDREMDDFLALLDNPDFAWMGVTVVAAWAKRPTP